MEDRSLTSPEGSPKNLIASLSTHKNDATESLSSNPATLAPVRPSIRTRPRKRPDTVELLVPALPRDPGLIDELPLFDLAARVDRLQAYVTPKSPMHDASPFSSDVPGDWESIRRLLRLDQQRLTLQDLDAIIARLTEHYKQVDDNWIYRVCSMLGQAKTYQLQLISIARTLQNIMNGPNSGVPYLESMNKCPFAEEDAEFGLPLRLVDIDEKAAIVLEHEHLIMHVAALVEKIHLMNPPEALIAKLANYQVTRDDSQPLQATARKLEQLEKQARRIMQEAARIEAQIFEIAQTIARANDLYTSIQRLKFIAAE